MFYWYFILDRWIGERKSERRAGDLSDAHRAGEDQRQQRRRRRVRRRQHDPPLARPARLSPFLRPRRRWYRRDLGVQRVSFLRHVRSRVVGVGSWKEGHTAMSNRCSYNARWNGDRSQAETAPCFWHMPRRPIQQDGEAANMRPTGLALQRATPRNKFNWLRRPISPQATHTAAAIMNATALAPAGLAGRISSLSGRSLAAKPCRVLQPLRGGSCCRVLRFGWRCSASQHAHCAISGCGQCLRAGAATARGRGVHAAAAAAAPPPVLRPLTAVPLLLLLPTGMRPVVAMAQKTGEKTGKQGKEQEVFLGVKGNAQVRRQQRRCWGGGCAATCSTFAVQRAAQPSRLVPPTLTAGHEGC